MLVRRLALPVSLLMLTLAASSTIGCKREGSSEAPGSTREQVASDDPSEGSSDDSSELESIGHADADYVGRELPAGLTGELHGPDGRIVVLAPGFVAASACIDCGAPTYLWFLAVRCKSEGECEVLTQSCEGRIVGQGREFTLAFTPIEGSDPKLCADYSGGFLEAE